MGLPEGAQRMEWRCVMFRSGFIGQSPIFLGERDVVERRRSRWRSALEAAVLCSRISSPAECIRSGSEDARSSEAFDAIDLQALSGEMYIENVALGPVPARQLAVQDASSRSDSAELWQGAR